MTAINESGLYSLVLRSKLPNAKKFKKWVTSEVLPSIRKTGSYQKPLSTQEKLSKSTSSAVKEKKVVTPRLLNEVKGAEAVRVKTGIGELDRVLGGGLVKGSLVLI